MQLWQELIGFENVGHKHYMDNSFSFLLVTCLVIYI